MCKEPFAAERILTFLVSGMLLYSGKEWRKSRIIAHLQVSNCLMLARVVVFAQWLH